MFRRWFKSKRSVEAPPPQDDYVLHSLTPELEGALDDALRFLHDYSVKIGRPVSREPNGDDLPSLQAIYEIFLDAEDLHPDAVLSLGLGFGRVLHSRGGFDWVRVTDQYGEETGLQVTGTTVSIAPISMIQKRLNRREKVCLAELVQETLKSVDDFMTKASRTDH